ncbi:MAG: hypothetical protein KDC46_16490 [Thermoleophilia bacterium]|nr:hypothetical protein [Thermoleophilia bacterium]
MDRSGTDDASARASVSRDAREEPVAGSTASFVQAEALVVEALTQSRHARRRLEKADERIRNADARSAEAALVRAAAEALAEESELLARHAREDSEEYERALYHYQQLVRHRLANPLQIILGLSEALLTIPDIDEDRQREMLAMIRQQAVLLGRASLFDTGQQGAEERELSAEPTIEER